MPVHTTPRMTMMRTSTSPIRRSPYLLVADNCSVKLARKGAIHLAGFPLPVHDPVPVPGTPGSRLQRSAMRHGRWAGRNARGYIPIRFDSQLGHERMVTAAKRSGMQRRQKWQVARVRGARAAVVLEADDACEDDLQGWCSPPTSR